MRVGVRAALIAGITLLTGCTTVDPGPNFVVPDEQFDADFFFCRIEPELLVSKKCGAGDPSLGDAANGCHFNRNAVSGMPIRSHDPVPCSGDRPTDRTLLSPGGAAQGTLQAVTLEMSRDVQTAPLYLRPSGQNHPRAIFPREDPFLDLLRQWAQK